MCTESDSRNSRGALLFVHCRSCCSQGMYLNRICGDFRVQGIGTMTRWLLQGTEAGSAWFKYVWGNEPQTLALRVNKTLKIHCT